MLPSEHALALHSAHPPIDLHADPLLWARWLGYDLNTRHEAPLPRAALGGHVDVPRMMEARMGGQFFGLVSLPYLQGDLERVCHEQIDILERACGRSEGKLRMARSATDVEKAREDGAIAALMGIEGAHTLGGRVESLDRFAARGVRYLGLLHFSANECGRPAYGWGRDDDKGLTELGRKVVERCQELGVIVDLAHINKRGFLEACAMLRKPPLVSHTGVSGVTPMWRNIDDEQIRAVADLGGCVGIIFVPQFVGGPGIEAVASHLEHVVRVAGEDAVALGSDWDGFVVPSRGLEDCAKLPALTEALIRRGMTDARLGKLLRGNALRVLREWSP